MPRARVFAPSCPPSGKPDTQLTRVPCPPQQLDPGPRQHVQWNKWSGQITPREPHPVAGVKPKIERVPSRVGDRMPRCQISRIPGNSPGLPHSPRKLDALVRVKERFGPPTNLLEHGARQKHCPFPAREDRARAARVTLSNAGDPAPRSGMSGGVNDPWLQQPNVGATRQQPAPGGEKIRIE